MQTPHDSYPTDIWDPHAFASSTADNPNYQELQAAVVDAIRGMDVSTVLDLGIGTGETTRRILQVYENATTVGVDASPKMLAAARTLLPTSQTTLLLSRIETPLPPGPFDLVVSVLAIHHLDSAGKADLFARINDVLAHGGHFVLADIVLDPQEVGDRRSRKTRLRRFLQHHGVKGTAGVICLRLWRRMKPSPNEPSGTIHTDFFDLLSDQIAWLTDAGLQAEVTWSKDLRVVVRAAKPTQRTPLLYASPTLERGSDGQRGGA
jgi:tRNA (cmo5U34)-methyltransferase